MVQTEMLVHGAGLETGSLQQKQISQSIRFRDGHNVHLLTIFWKVKNQKIRIAVIVLKRTGPKLIEPLQVSGNWRGVFSSIQGECIHSIIAENFTINMRHSNDKNIYVVEAVGENQFGPFEWKGN